MLDCIVDCIVLDCIVDSLQILADGEFAVLDVPASAMYFMSYEWLQRVLTPEGHR